MRPPAQLPGVSGDLVGGKVVHDRYIAGPERRHKKLLHVGEEGFAVHRAIEHQRSDQPVMAENRDQRGRLPVPVRHGAHQAVTPETAPKPASHVRGGPGLVQEDQLRGIELRLLLGPAGAGFRDVRAILLGRAENFF